MKFPKHNSRPAHTLLFIADDKSWRVDCDNKGIFLSEIEVFQAGCKHTAKLGNCIENITKDSDKFGRKLWLIFSRLPSTILSLASLQVRGLDDESLMQVMLYELESMTGQSAMDTLLSYQFLGSQHDMSDYRVSYIDQLEYEDMVTAIKKSGGQLAGLVHPAGLPQCLSNPEADDWFRIENWASQLVTVRDHPIDGLSTQIYSKELSTWHANLEQDMAQAVAPLFSETLTNFDLELLPETEVILDITKDDDLSVLINAWATCLIVANDCPVPLLKTVSKINKDLMFMVGGGVAALLLCSLHFGWHTYQKNYYEVERDSLKTLETTINKVRTTVSDLKKQRSELKRKQTEIESDSTTIPTLLEALKKRPSHLLYALAKGSNEGLMIESIDHQGDKVIVRGITLKASYANKLALHLNDQLANLGWQISPPEKVDMALLVEGGPWEFSLQLNDLGILSFTNKTEDGSS